MKRVFVLYNMRVFQLFENGDLSTDLLLSYQLIVHFLDGDLSTPADVPTPVDFPIRPLPNAIFLSENIVSHLYFYIFVHLLSLALY